MSGQIIRVIVVENNPALCDGISDLLAHAEGIALVCTVNIDNGFKTYCKLTPDVVIVDSTCIGGSTLIQQIRRAASTARIISLVGYEHNQQLQAASPATEITLLPIEQIANRLVFLIREYGSRNVWL